MVDARCPVVYGRDAEIAVLRAALAAAREGRGGLVALSGVPGVGKSRLLTDLMAAARREGWVVATGRAVSGHSATPYRPLAEALLPLTRDLDARGMEGLGPWRAGLRAVLADPVEGKAQARADPLVRGEAVVRLLRAITTSGPVLVGLEDLQWADPDTLAVVEYLADHLMETAATCVVTVRSQPRCAATDLVHTLSARRNIALVTLAPLEDAAVAAMVKACRPAAAADTVDEVVTAAEGIPFLVEELLSAPGLPPSFASAVAARLDELTPAERAVVVAAAVFGRQFDWQLLASACGQDEDEDEVAAALAAARQRLLVDVEGGRFAFRHALTREAVLDGLPPPQHRRVARACLAAFEAAHPALGGERRPLAAALAGQAGLDVRAASLLVELGTDALRRGALATAISTLSEALGGAPDDATRHVAQAQLVEALASAGRTDECLAAGAQLLRETPAANVTVRVRTHLALAEAAVEATRWSSVDSQLTAAQSLLAVAPDPTAQARWHVLTAEAALAHRDLDGAQRWAEEALAAPTAAADVRCHALVVLGRSRRVSDLDAARTAFEQALGVAEGAGLPLARLKALHELGTIELFDHAGTRWLVQAHAQAEELGALSTAAVLDVQLAAASLFRFDPGGVAEHAAAALVVAERLHLELLRATATVFLAEGEGLRGDRDAMERHNVAALAAAPDDAEIAGSVWGGRAVAALLADDRAAARRSLDRAHALLAPLPNAGPAIYLGLRPLLMAVDDDEGAQAAIRAAAAGTIVVNRADRGLLGWADAVLAGRAGLSAKADELADRATADLAAFPVWFDLARMLVADAAQSDGWGQPRLWLSTGAATFAERGLEALAHRCRAAMGPEPEPLAALGVTSREHEILRLVALGLSNRDIANRLTVSPRTVEKHVESLLRKTGARSRTQLVSRTARSRG